MTLTLLGKCGEIITTTRCKRTPIRKIKLPGEDNMCCNAEKGREYSLLVCWMHPVHSLVTSPASGRAVTQTTNL